MKGLYFPDSLKRFALKHCSPFAQALFYELIAYSDAEYAQRIWPSIETMQRAFTRIGKDGKKKIASRNTIISAIKELEAHDILIRKPHFERNRQTTNRLIVNFALWEPVDRARGIKFGWKVDTKLRLDQLEKIVSEQSVKIDRLDERQTARIDSLFFGMKTLSDTLKAYLETMDYQGERDGVKVFTRRTPFVNEFVELEARQKIQSEFARKGIQIVIEKAS